MKIMEFELEIDRYMLHCSANVKIICTNAKIILLLLEEKFEIKDSKKVEVEHLRSYMRFRKTKKISAICQC